MEYSFAVSGIKGLAHSIHKFLDQAGQMLYRSGFTECSPPEAADTMYLGGSHKRTENER